MSAVLDYLPSGNTLSDAEWQRRHKLLQILLAAHLPALFVFGLARGFTPTDCAETLALPLACLIVGHLLRSRRLAAGFVTLGLIYCSAALVGFSHGAIEAHFHFFIMIGFIALYQDWVPFLLNILFTVLSHGIGSTFVPDLMFNHASAQQHPWEWSLIHGVAVLAACVGVVLFWKSTEDEQARSLALTQQLADAEVGRRRFTSDLLVNLARRNQNLLYRQLDLLNELEDKEPDPDALADLFRLDHLATRIRRNAESLLVLSGEDSPRTWREPVQLVDVIRAAIAEIEDLHRVDDTVDETLAVSGRSVADLTHLFAELLENAVHFSPPGVTVVVRSRPLPSSPGTHLVTIEDWGVGMTTQELAEANDILRSPREVDLSMSQRLGLHVVARLAQRYGITVELTPTPGGGVTAVAVLPPGVFQRAAELVGAAAGTRSGYGHAAGSPRASDAPGAVLSGPARVLDSGPDFGAGPALGAGPLGAGPAVGAPRGSAAANGSAAAGLAGPGDLGVAPAAVLPAVPARAPVRPPAPVRPTPPLPADLNGAEIQLPRRGPGESLARSRLSRPADEILDVRGPSDRIPSDRIPADAPAAADRTMARPPRAPAAGGDGAAQPGYGPGTGTTDDAGNGNGNGADNGNGSGWSSWWTRATPAEAEDPRQPDPRPAPDPRPEPNGSTPPELPEPPNPLPEPRPPTDWDTDRDTDRDTDDGRQLRRRVPQAHLAAGLRRETEQPAHDDTPVVRDPMAARNALSRFQAAQRAARGTVDGDPPDGGPAR